jgi:predicted nucleotidyltransferase
MDRETVIEVLRSHADEIHARGAAALYLFGSTARGEAGPESDVDLMMEIADRGKFSLLDQVGLQNFLSDLLGVDADLSVRASIHPLIKDSVEEDAIKVL